MICNPDDKDVAQFAYKVFEVPETVDCIQGILAVIPLQLLSFHIATQKGLNVRYLPYLIYYTLLIASYKYVCHVLSFRVNP